MKRKLNVKNLLLLIILVMSISYIVYSFGYAILNIANGIQFTNFGIVSLFLVGFIGETILTHFEENY